MKGGQEISITIYEEDLEKEIVKGSTVDEVVEKIIKTYEAEKCPSFDLDEILERENVLRNVHIAFQKAGSEPLVKRNSEFSGIEEYLLIFGDDYSIKLTVPVLENLGISEEKLWEVAKENTMEGIVIKDMLSMIFYGIDEELEYAERESLYVVTNKSGIKGASCVINKEQLKNFWSKLGVRKIVLLPSSIHEMIMKPYEDGDDIDYLKQMVIDSNGAVVLPQERLVDDAFIIEF